MVPQPVAAGAKYSQIKAYACIMLVLLVHLIWLRIITGPVSRPVAIENRVWVRLLQPELSPPSFHKKNLPQRVGISRKAVTHPSEPFPASLALLRVSKDPSKAMSASADEVAKTNTTEEYGITFDAKATKASAGSLPRDLVQQALKGVGDIDRQLRSEHGQEIVITPNMLLTRLAKGLAEAHASVKPKWFEAARTELISAPNDPKRVYRVTTAMGSYCLYFPDKGSISSNSSPKSGLADFGQPTASTCPTRF